MNFSTTHKGRSWVATIQIENMVKAGLTEEQYKNPEIVANYFKDLWEGSGKGRTAGISVCRSADGLYHCHAALYGNLTTLKNVADILFQSHVEPQLGGKKELRGYLLKEPPYEEKGEEVLYSIGIENLQDRQGHRSDLDEIQEMINSGMNPNEIMDMNIKYRLHERIIKSAFFSKRKRETPVDREIKVIWHTGESRTGKTYTYVQLVNKYGESEVYMLSDYITGGLDNYMGEKILFMDEFKGNIPYQDILNYLEGYKKQIHCRYANAYHLWEEVHITSIYPPEEVYDLMTQTVNRKRDSIEQLLKRITTVVYHYKQGEKYCQYEIPGSEYVDYEDLKQRALSSSDGFVPVENAASIPF